MLIFDEGKQRAIKLNIWDTLGQEKFKSNAKLFFRGAAGALLVFDLSNRTSFDSLDEWHQQITDSCGPGITVTLLGNKSELGDRQVFYNEASDYARKRNMNYVEVSAKTGRNISQAFKMIVEMIYHKTKDNDSAMFEVFENDRRISLHENTFRASMDPQMANEDGGCFGGPAQHN